MDQDCTQPQNTARPDSSATGQPPSRCALPPPVDWIDRVLFIPFLFCFVTTLIVFDVLQRIAIRVSPRAHEISVYWLNLWLQACTRVVGTRLTIEGSNDLPLGKPYIIISNHQSIFDTVFLSVLFRSVRPRFIAKQELARWIPSISYNLVYGGSAVIDRTNARQAIQEIRKLADRMKEGSFAVVIFPEGTRARTGALKDFRPAGVLSLIDSVPEAPIIPVAIDGAWKLVAYRHGPIPRALKVRVRILPELERTEDNKDIVAAAQRCIQTAIDEMRSP